MGLSRRDFGTMKSIAISIERLSLTEIATIETAGIDVDIAELQVLEDGTFAYKNRRVVLYIRDVADYGGRYSEPRFHLSNCQTLREMKSNQRMGRYVVASRSDGLFRINYISGSVRSEDKPLMVCQNCLDNLCFDGFQRGMEATERDSAVKMFSIERFFVRFPKSLHLDMPIHTDRSAPLNQYPTDFEKISLACRRAAKWRCSSRECGIHLEAGDLRRYLHAHHQDGDKSNNGPENLVALCIYCHANTYQHGHLKATIEYKEFLAIRDRLL